MHTYIQTEVDDAWHSQVAQPNPLLHSRGHALDGLVGGERGARVRGWGGRAWRRGAGVREQEEKEMGQG